MNTKLWAVKFEVVTSVFLTFKVSWDSNLCRWVTICRRFGWSHSLLLHGFGLVICIIKTCDIYCAIFLPQWSASCVTRKGETMNLNGLWRTQLWPLLRSVSADELRTGEKRDDLCQNSRWNGKWFNPTSSAVSDNAATPRCLFRKPQTNVDYHSCTEYNSNQRPSFWDSRALYWVGKPGFGRRPLITGCRYEYLDVKLRKNWRMELH